VLYCWTSGQRGLPTYPHPHMDLFLMSLLHGVSWHNLRHNNGASPFTLCKAQVPAEFQSLFNKLALKDMEYIHYKRLPVIVARDLDTHLCLPVRNSHILRTHAPSEITFSSLLNPYRKEKKNFLLSRRSKGYIVLMWLSKYHPNNTWEPGTKWQTTKIYNSSARSYETWGKFELNRWHSWGTGNTSHYLCGSITQWKYYWSVTEFRNHQIGLQYQGDAVAQSV
jgi:hypothetical protein